MLLQNVEYNLNMTFNSGFQVTGLQEGTIKTLADKDTGGLKTFQFVPIP